MPMQAVQLWGIHAAAGPPVAPFKVSAVQQCILQQPMTPILTSVLPCGLSPSCLGSRRHSHASNQMPQVMPGPTCCILQHVRSAVAAAPEVCNLVLAHLVQGLRVPHSVLDEHHQLLECGNEALHAGVKLL